MKTPDPEQPGAPHVDVSDIFDAFHEMASLALARFELRDSDADDPAGEPTFEDIVDQLELDLFLPACAHRLWRLHGVRMDPDEVGSFIHLHDHEGQLLHGAAGLFHSHAFAMYTESDVPNEVLSGDLLPRSRDSVRLILHGGEAAGGGRPRPKRTPLKVI
jgi:hypothetical protein